MRLTSLLFSSIKDVAAVCGGLAGGGRPKRGDLGQLAPRKKLLKSFSSFPEDFLRPSEHSLARRAFCFLPPRCPHRHRRTELRGLPCLRTTSFAVASVPNSGAMRPARSARTAFLRLKSLTTTTPCARSLTARP